MITITKLKIPLVYDMDLLKELAAARLGINTNNISLLKIMRKAIDKSETEDIHFRMNVAIEVTGVNFTIRHRDKDLSEFHDIIYKLLAKRLKSRPVVVGCGPAGLFAALILALAGTCPILLERGGDVDTRREKVAQLRNSGVLDTTSNIQFGEGGAGTFSDGKLKVGKLNQYKAKVLTEFIEAGAPEEIMYLEKAHIGTDRLVGVVKRIREKIISLGGEVKFGSLLTEILHRNGKVTGIGYISHGIYAEICTDNVILAIGHSARDTFIKLLDSGVKIEQKPFAVGVRIEHLQSTIDRLQYGRFAGHSTLGASDYKMAVHLGNGRSVYSFCMCPGGFVVPATSQENCQVTNGMSLYDRDGTNANAAIIVTVGKEDIQSDMPLAGVDFQQKLERAAYVAGDGGYKAPVQRLGDFFDKKNTSSFGDVIPTYKPGTSFAQVDSFLPDFVCDSLRQGIKEMDDWMPGFAQPDAILTGAETRSSSPVQIKRNERREAIGIVGLYPCGEGAGYAGGIISAAVDGILCAESVLS